MISRLRGVVAEIDGDVAVIDVQGVGYEVICTSALVANLAPGAEATVTIYTDVKEDSIRLFGFDSPAERHVFLLLKRVSGMGPRSALDVISNVAIRDLLRAIGSGDIRSLMAIKGVGKKKAERIIVELKDLVVAMAGERSTNLRSLVTVERVPASGPATLLADAIAALEVLGFPRRDAEAAVHKAMEQGVGEGNVAPQSGDPEVVGSLVREALRFI